LTKESKLPGLDGRKMSKSYGNSIALGESMDSVRKKVMSMLTDTNRMRKADPGNPDVCNLFPYHQIMTDPERLPEIDKGCRDASWGCVDCKKLLLESMEHFVEPIHARRKEIDANPDMVWDILRDGNRRAEAVAEEHMDALRAHLNLNF
jgi:tryptophanyl-tRNA synthetase